MNRKNLTIKDIARMAGVSAGTVDRVLHNRGKVSEDAFKKVMAILDQIDYKPNLIARTLGSKRALRIAALLPDPSQDPYWELCGHGLQQAENEWVQYGVSVVPYYFKMVEKESFVNAAEAALEDNPDGVLSAPIFYHEALPFLERCYKQAIPYILFNTNIEEAHPLSFIGQDLYQSGRLGAELMLIGQRMPCHFAVLHIDEDVHEAIHLSQKEKGFRDFLADKGPDVKISAFDFSHEKENTLEEKFHKLLQDKTLNGIFASTSSGTYITAAFIEKSGRQDLRVVGYDLLEKNLQFMKAGIINFLINQNPKRQAFQGVGQLANHLLFKKPVLPKNLFPLEIITPENLNSYLNSGIYY